jgi:hypothetical protein
MVARIKTPNNIVRALNYNEQKVKQGHAVLIHAANYLKDTDKLRFADKLKRFHDLIALNERAKTNSLHISLNFDNADRISKELLTEIANQYMIKIGFGEQPYLVYQHHDAGHPHVHIVTTSIKHDGKRIDTFNIGRNQSETGRKEIEQRFRLIQAEKKHSLNYELKPVDVQKVLYGKAETKRAITNVLDHVLSSYKYASLAELNAVLQQYDIIADRGAEHSRIYQNKGLVYRILDTNKQKVGVPIKASLIYSKPTLKNIEANFEKNEAERSRHKQRVTNAIDLLLLKHANRSLPELMKALQKENIHVVLRQNDNGVIYGITYVDHKTKCVFKGSHLGKQYSAITIQQRCSSEHPEIQKQQPLQQLSGYEAEEMNNAQTGLYNMLDDLVQPENNQYTNEPPEQKKFKKRKKRKQRQSHS